MASPLEQISHLLVTDTNPPRKDLIGMDSDRCIALHNAILQHGWENSGRSTEEFVQQSQTWWEAYGDSADTERLHPSLLAFLYEARITPFEHRSATSFFYYVEGLLDMHGLYGWSDTYSYLEDPDLVVTLYNGHSSLAGKPEGLLYNQHDHTAVMRADITDIGDTDLDHPFKGWVKLESILSVWIEMIQKKKVIVLAPGDNQNFNTSPERLDDDMSPWIMQAWSLKDLGDSLETWQMAVDEIERKMGIEASDENRIAGIYDATTLDNARITEGFARQFLLKARRPRFKHIAPGLRISEPIEFIDQPFIEVHTTSGEESTRVAPILLLRNDATMSTRDLGFQYPYSGAQALVPRAYCGLWLDTCDRTSVNMPFEDGCRLVLPFVLDAGWAKKSDMSVVDQADSLLQLGSQNPYIEPHPFQLQAFLEIVYLNVQRGHWEVDEQGVADEIDVWKNADTEEMWRDYIVHVRPGAFW